MEIFEIVNNRIEKKEVVIKAIIYDSNTHTLYIF